MPIKSKRIVCPPELRDEAMAVIASKRIIDPASGCWIKIGRPSPDGYSYIHVCGMRGLWHRVCYAVCHGLCQEDSVIDHLCNNRRCGNPAHLASGTSADNMRSIAINGTHWTKNRRWLIPHGESHTQSKISNSEVIKIWSRLDTGTPHRVIEDEYSVSQTTVVWLAKRYSYRHLLTETEIGIWPPRKKYHSRKRTSVSSDVQPNEKDRSRFSKRLRTLPNGCKVLPKLHDQSRNAAMFSIGGKNSVVARAAWILEYGPITPGLVVRHKCHNGHNHCCNVEHLILGTSKDNSHDMTVAGRGGKTKLTKDDVVKAFSMYATGEFILKQLADVFHVTCATISKVLRRDTHAHVVIDHTIENAVKSIRHQRQISHSSTPRTEISDSRCDSPFVAPLSSIVR